MYIAKLSQDHPKLAMEEIKTWCNPEFNFPFVILPEEPFKFAFVKGYGKLIADSLDVDWSFISDPYYIRTEGISKEIIKEVPKQVTQPVSMDGKQLFLIKHKNKTYVAWDWHEMNHHFEERKTHNLPAPHPSSLHPKIAKAMIHLLHAPKGSKICDPFCGSGSLLIEAGLLGYKIYGSDINQKMIERAKQNLDSFSLNACLERRDAKTLNIDLPYLICDLPYGRNTQGDPGEAWKIFISLFEQHGHRAVLGIPSNLKIEHPSIIFSYTYPLHSSLSKTILVLDCSEHL